ncbi:MAG: phage protease [Candidatus Brevundimonas colombiensis]|uniref:Phage protease n=1 Tax=Candidatus Brevundimonas colombiensis TaxID=3121376 RepID=A0AAJ6BK65_9CAUL|nr:phage protease [Brevundimonas sp.]WEK38674.1 MAG: phage protease [Brevundimonas sp.]
MNTPSATANKQTGATISTPIQSIALNEAGTAPEWIELIPAGFDVQGRDGRAWINPDPQGVVTATAADTHPLPLDWEHATENRAPQGLDAPAAGWIEETAVRDGGAIWGRVDWTLRGRTMVEAREYRFISPVFAYDKVTGVIRRLVSAALTNTPNLLLTALNRQSDDHGTDQPNREQENPLSIAQRLATVLGLAANATDDQIVTAVTEAKAANRSVDLSSYAPRADLDAAVNRANTAEAALKAKTDEDHAKAIDAALAAAQDAGKIIPASVDDYRAMCTAEGGLDRFNNLVKTMPVIAGAAESRASNKAESANTGSDLTDEERAVCRALGQDEATFKSNQKKAN